MGTVNSGLQKYNELNRNVKNNGGPDQFIKIITKKGEIKGSLITLGVCALAAGVSVLVYSIVKKNKDKQKIQISEKPVKITIEKDEEIQLTGITDSEDVVIKKDKNEYLVNSKEFDKIVKNSKKDKKE